MQKLITQVIQKRDPTSAEIEKKGPETIIVISSTIDINNLDVPVEGLEVTTDISKLQRPVKKFYVVNQSSGVVKINDKVLLAITTNTQIVYDSYIYEDTFGFDAREEMIVRKIQYQNKEITVEEIYKNYKKKGIKLFDGIYLNFLDEITFENPIRILGKLYGTSNIIKKNIKILNVGLKTDEEIVANTTILKIMLDLDSDSLNKLFESLIQEEIPQIKEIQPVIQETPQIKEKEIQKTLEVEIKESTPIILVQDNKLEYDLLSDPKFIKDLENLDKENISFTDFFNDKENPPLLPEPFVLEGFPPFVPEEANSSKIKRIENIEPKKKRKSAIQQPVSMIPIKTMTLPFQFISKNPIPKRTIKSLPRIQHQEPFSLDIDDNSRLGYSNVFVPETNFKMNFK
jgi:hypothetical protein